MKTLNKSFLQDKEKFVIPRCVQDSIPIRQIWNDGIFLVGYNEPPAGKVKIFFQKLFGKKNKVILQRFTKTFKFTDINYSDASIPEKKNAFLQYSELLNSLDSNALTKISVVNRRLNENLFRDTILIAEQGNDMDSYRREYNNMLLDKARGANAIIQDKYITISVKKKSIDEARTYFSRIAADLTTQFNRLGSTCTELDGAERLRLLHDFYRAGNETAFEFNEKSIADGSQIFKDMICPDSVSFEKDHFKMGDKYGRVLYISGFANYIKDSILAELCEINRNLVFSIDIFPVPVEEAIKEAEKRLLGVNTNITNWQRKQNSNNNYSAEIPYELEQQRKELKEFLDDLTTRDQRSARERTHSYIHR